METDLDFSQLTAEERTEILKKKAKRKSASPMGYIHPQKIRELLANTDLSKPVFKQYEEPIIMRVPKLAQQCPKCEKYTKHHLDIKFLKWRGKCFDCILKEEHEIRLAGLWDEYENWKIMENQLAWLKDTKDETEDYLENSLKTSQEFIREDGTIEKWENPNFERDKIFIQDKLKELIKVIEELQIKVAPMREKFDYYEPLKKIKENVTKTT